MTVNTRAIDLRTVLLQFHELRIAQSPVGDAHLGQLRCRPAGDLLHSQSQELVLQFRELFRQVILRPKQMIRSGLRRDGDTTRKRTWTGARTPLLCRAFWRDLRSGLSAYRPRDFAREWRNFKRKMGCSIAGYDSGQSLRQNSIGTVLTFTVS